MAGNGVPGCCLKCGKNVGPQAQSVKCSTCQLVVHAGCEDIAAEMCNKLAKPEQSGLSWNCAGCRTSSARLEGVVQQLARKVDDLERRLLQKVDKKDVDHQMATAEEVDSQSDAGSQVGTVPAVKNNSTNLHPVGTGTYQI